MRESDEITRVLEELGAGDEAALDALFSAVYQQLRRLAHRQRRRWRGQETLNTTALLHEAYLKIAASERPRFAHRGHFFAIASRAMRQILVDRARRADAIKRGGDRQRSPLDEHELPAPAPRPHPEILSLDAALDRLEALDERQARVVECRFFGGLDVDETAEAVGVSTATVKRDWRSARAWLYRELTSGRAAP